MSQPISVQDSENVIHWERLRRSIFFNINMVVS